MDNKIKKVPGKRRKELILEWLMNTNQPITGSELAARTNVSRQVIVQDISLLKAKDYPILATSQGYILIKDDIQNQTTVRKQIACFHSSDPEVTSEELNTIVDYGAKVIDVSVEHPIYGDLTASLMLSNRREVDQFLQGVQKTNASLLSELTDGTHLHTIEAPSEKIFQEVECSLKKKGFLLT